MHGSVQDLLGILKINPRESQTTMKKLKFWWNETSIHEFINRKLVVLVKHGFLAISFMLFTLVSFYVLERHQTQQACSSRNRSRLELKQTLLHIVDLSDLFPGDDTAGKYTDSRTFFINNNPALAPLEC